MGFAKGTLEKLGLEFEVERVGEYKNAPDGYTRSRMSPEQREALDHLIGGIFDYYMMTVSTARGMEPDSLLSLVNHGPFGASEARQAGLIDGIGYRRAVLQSLGVTDDSEVISLERYASAILPERGKRVAYIVVEGAIMPGGSLDFPVMEPVAGSETIARALRTALLDDSFHGILLRINSPGGSAMASDIIWDEVRNAAAKKPVVVSFGDVAASGGYYIA